MNNYNLIEKVLHNLCFNYKFINKGLFDLEKLLYLNKKNLADIKNQIHIFISGLPRSGTTSILNYIFSSNEYASLTYKDMPFLFSPNLTSKITFNNIPIDRLRAHNDRIKFNLNSPEAFDEVFIKYYDDDDLSQELLNYISLILKFYNKKKYISKNNNNFKRINFLKKNFPNSKFLIPFRDPLQQSFSLLNQHKNFLKIHNEDNFTLKYMNFLGHYEFGKNHIPWFKSKLFFNTFDLNYWLEQWIEFYENILISYSKDKKNFKILCFERLDDPKYLTELNNFIKLNKDNFGYFKIIRKEVNVDYDKKVYFKAIELYEKLNNLS